MHRYAGTFCSISRPVQALVSLASPRFGAAAGLFQLGVEEVSGWLVPLEHPLFRVRAPTGVDILVARVRRVHAEV